MSAFTFIDLFAGIGGFRIALESFGGKCVFSSEWDKNSQQTYLDNFGEMPSGDITKIDEADVPEHDVLCAGFPCQSFSVSGKQLGFDDTRGTLFRDIARIAKYRKPKVLFLENVKNLLRHDGGKTIQVILGTLNEIGYTPFVHCLRSSDFGVPQARERIYIVCFRTDLGVTDFEYPTGNAPTMVVRDILEQRPTEARWIERDDISLYGDEHTVKDVRKPLQIGKINRGGQGERIYSIYASGITLSAYGGGVASKTGAYLIDGKIRKLTPLECARMQGFPATFVLPKNKNVAYKQFGDSVSVPVLEAIFKNILAVLRGSATAKAGFQNEGDVVDKFDNWKRDSDAQAWLAIMGYAVDTIDTVTAAKVTGSHKTDVQVTITTQTGVVTTENISIKLVSNPVGFNQIDKRWVEKYVDMWVMPEPVAYALKLFTGELSPTVTNLKDPRRMFLNELDESQQRAIVSFFESNKAMIAADILKGRDTLAASWMLIFQKPSHVWSLLPMTAVTDFYSAGEVVITPQGSLRIGKITMQRKGGDGGRPSANMLQFKINPCAIVRAISFRE